MLARTNTALDVPQPEPTGIWRWIIELSCMSNNDEIVLHCDHDISHEEFYNSDLKRKLGGPFRSPKLYRRVR